MRSFVRDFFFWPVLVLALIHPGAAAAKEESSVDLESCAKLIRLADFDPKEVIPKVENGLQRLIGDFGSIRGQLRSLAFSGLVERYSVTFPSLKERITFKRVAPLGEMIEPELLKLAEGAHDLLGDVLALIELNLRLLTEELKNPGANSEASKLELVNGIIAAAREGLTITEVMLNPELEFARAHQTFLASHYLKSLREITSGISRKVRLKFVTPEEDFLIRADLSAYKRVGLNFINNAAQAMDGQADAEIEVSLRVEPPRSKDVAAQNGEIYSVVLAVADNGPGIPPELESSVYTAGISSKGPGRGLGLSSVLNIADANNAEVRFDRNPGRGTTFKFTLSEQTLRPAPRKEALSIKPVKILTAPTVLIIDDQEAIAETTAMFITLLSREMFGPIPIETYTTDNGEEAIRLMRSNPGMVKVAIVDVNGIRSDRGHTHLMDHVDLMKELRKADGAALLYQCSGQVAQSDPVPYFADGNLPKPAEEAQIVQMLRQAIHAPERVPPGSAR